MYPKIVLIEVGAIAIWLDVGGLNLAEPAAPVLVSKVHRFIVQLTHMGYGNAHENTVYYNRRK